MERQGGVNGVQVGGRVLLDEARNRIRLSGAQLNTLGAVATGEELSTAAERAALEQLRAAGVVGEGLRIHPLAAELARASAMPLIRVVVEVLGPQGPTLAYGSVHGEDVWLSEPWPAAGPDDPVVYQRSELPTLLWDLARSVGLRRSRPPADAASVSLPVKQLDDVLEVVLALSPEQWEEGRSAAVTALTADLPEPPGLASEPVLDPQARTRLIATLASLESSWRITVGWGGPRDDGSPGPVRSLAVLDCGVEGLWRRNRPQDPLLPLRPDDVVRLEPVTAGEVWRSLGELLPSSAQLQDEAAARADAGRVR